ncbi:MAG: Mut7-C RNAse domain-containing protein [Spirochaetota bacterium]
MSVIVRLTIPDELVWCVYSGRTWDSGELLLPWIENQSVKDCIESAGIPHTEVAEYAINGQKAFEDQILSPGDEVEITPFRKLPYMGRTFVLDVHLGKLAVFLRLAGFLALYQPNRSRSELIELSHRDGHLLVTRSRNLLKHRELERGMLIRSSQPREQLKEIFSRFDISNRVAILSICPRCNGRLEPVSKQRIIDRLEPKTRQWYQDFYQCQACGQIYWEGSHYPAYLHMLEHIRQELRQEAAL